jgi:hypothetical protein
MFSQRPNPNNLHWEEFTPEKTSEKVSNFLAYYRVFGTLIMIFIATLVLGYESVMSIIFLTNWGIFSTLLYFLSQCLAPKFPDIKKKVPGILAVSWSLDWGINIVYWGYVHYLVDIGLFNAIVLHCTPIVLIVIDYIFSDLIIDKKHYKYTLIVLAAYFVVNFSYTFTQNQVVYPGITYKNFISYLTIGFGLFVSLASLEIGRVVKLKYFAKTPNELQNSTELREAIF